MSTPNAVAALIHDRLGQTLRDVFGRALNGNPATMFQIQLQPGDSLVAQLEEPGEGPPRVTLGFVLDIVTSSISASPDIPGPNLPNPGELLQRVQSALKDRLVLFGRLRENVATLVAAEDPVSIRRAGDALFAKIDEAFAKSGQDNVFESVGQWVRLQPFIGGDVGTVLPFATLVTAVQGNLQNALRVPQSVERGLLDYFFRTDGYHTVDGSTIVAPVHLSDLGRVVSVGGLGATEDPVGLHQLRGLFPKTTAEHYIRDTIRVIVESGYDTGRGVGDLYKEVTGKLRSRKPERAQQDAIERKFVAWFRGFSAMAESATMRGVEVATQGVSQFQTNPLIAAAAGSFAGTVARKLAQDSFLALLRAELTKG